MTPDDVLDLLSRLADKSLLLVEAQAHSARYAMLETIREYTLERLARSGEAAGVARRHAEFFLALAEKANTEFGGLQAADWLTRLEVEHDNLRAALGRLLGHDPEECLRLVVALSEFWSSHGHYAEGRRWLNVALGRSDSAPALLRVKVTRCAGELAWRQGDLAAARACLEESLRMVRETGDASQIAWSTFHLALVILQQGDTRASRAYLEESLASGRELGNYRLMGNALNSLGEIARMGASGRWRARFTNNPWRFIGRSVIEPA